MQFLGLAYNHAKHPEARHAGDRNGFELTRENDRLPMSSELRDVRFDAATYNDFDLCFVFPREISRGSRLMDDTAIAEALDLICRAHIGRNLLELNSNKKLHPVYRHKELLHSCQTKQDVADAMRRMFFNVLEHIGAIYIAEEGHDKHKDLFVRVRLSESGCRTIADFKKYPLQLDDSCVRFSEYIRDKEFTTPHVPYEGMTGGLRAITRREKQLWKKYDRLGRPLRRSVHPYNQEQSLFRDVDRIRLLRTGLLEFLNIEVMVREGFIKQYYAIKQPCVERALEMTWASPKFTCSLIQPLELIRHYYGEEIAMYYAWLGFYCKLSLIPAMLGTVVMAISITFNKDLSFSNLGVNLTRMAYCVVIGVWCCLSFSLWARREAVLSLRWGVERSGISSIHQEESPFFRGDGYTIDPVHPEKFIQTYDTRKHHLRRALTNGVVVFTMVLVVIAVNDDLNDWLMSKLGAKTTDLYRNAWIGALSATAVSMMTSLSIKVYDLVRHLPYTHKYIAFTAVVVCGGLAFGGIRESSILPRLPELDQLQALHVQISRLSGLVVLPCLLQGAVGALY
eukprot:Blabericola_migrator_1__553@NODE_1136_length_5316_cov_209_214517_g772_i0_p2_GENE_NODE_1136_length_5316_cov_209_214517_g772_i0NODE_1136_length_5316_cov_209_214517_g772_i0_p2_ORF_typecomplete_len566_score71_75Anoctamin/PF04547_12/6_6e25NIF3/PF01784_18/0_028Anoct_dimer/PF16178_5/0_073Polysacc_synt_C/PF14667_6/6_9e02Polysacc_synt_C/PF14667_6/0_056_NODE_1136_length_5316_cov_209_214517_g772_i021699